MSHVGRIARQTALLSTAQFLGLGIGLLGTVLVTRALGPEGRAVYAWLLTLVGIAIQLALVAPPAVVRAVAVAAPRRLPATLVLLCLAGAVLTVPLAVYVLLDRHIGPEARPYLALAWLAVPVTATTLALNTMVQIEGRPGRVLAVHVGPRILQVAMIAGTAAAGRLDLPAAMTIFVLTSLVELALVLVCLRGRVDGFVPSLPLVRDVLRLLGAGWVSSLAIFAVPRIGLVVLGSYAPLETTGRYSVALTLQEAALVAPIALGGVLITHVGRHGVFGRRTQERGGLSILAFSAATCALAGLIAPQFITLTFGEAFAPAAGPFRIILGSVVLATLYQLCQPFLYARRNAVAIAGPSIGACLATLAAALLAVPRLGLTGAILSNVVGFATLAGLAFLLARRPWPRRRRT